LADGGAEQFARTIKAVRLVNPEVAIEVLTPDFNDDDRALDTVFNARPDVFNHNIETVRRLTPNVRSRATYERSLSVLRKARQRLPADCRTKSGLMLGLGEEMDEVLEAFRDLRAVGCEILTIGQYLQPEGGCLPVAEYVRPELFDELGKRALAMGFACVASAPRVRSSYRADCLAGARTGR
ncbi:MAG: lipoyl synthase, partial [Verrucomicrobiia bacterium]